MSSVSAGHLANLAGRARLLPTLTVSPTTQLVKSPETSFRMLGMSLVSAANQLIARSPIAKKHSIVQSRGTHAL